MRKKKYPWDWIGRTLGELGNRDFGGEVGKGAENDGDNWSCKSSQNNCVCVYVQTHAS